MSIKSLFSIMDFKSGGNGWGNRIKINCWQGYRTAAIDIDRKII